MTHQLILVRHGESQGNIQGIPWPQIASGVLLFVVPIVVFTVLVRKHLLRGVTFGTTKQ